ncbi:MAG: twin-arginine translocation signal domain-containing protein, partial [Acidimicrobiales bacterium]|nr:twin-arginine translocation signal domain-containing protein [Acidimicrobiales bacterium]
MASIDRRRFLVGSLGVMSAAALASCTTDSGSSSGAAGGEGGGTNAAGGPVPPASIADALAAPGTPGLVDEAWYQGRVDEYLQFATTDLDPASLTQIAAFLIRARREPDFVWDPSQVTVDTLADTWEQIDTWQDT